MNTAGSRKVLSELKGTIHIGIRKMLNKLSLGLGTRFTYRIRVGKKLNLKNPEDFNEKIQWLNYNWQHPLIIQTADKYAVRKYLKEKKVEEILNPLYAVYENPEEINWDILPKEFVLKTNNGCGSAIVVRDKATLDKANAISRLKKWLNENYSLEGGEFQYEKMKPLVIAEKYIESENDFLPVDYKFFCFNGEPKFVSVVDSRSVEDVRGENINKFYFDLNWKPLDILKNNPPLSVMEGIKKPENFDDMIEYSKILSEDFPFVRVDLYNEKGKVVFGELTFTPSAGMATYYKDGVLLQLGKMISLPNQKIYSR